MYMANMSPNARGPTQPIFHWLVLGVALGEQGFALYVWGFALGARGCLDTNMLVSATRNSCVGGIAQREYPTRVVSRCSEI